mgnify:CR=1 FL=1
MILLKQVTSEKIVKMMERENKLLFSTDRKSTKDEIKKEFESMFSVKVEKINTFLRGNKKYAYIKLDKSSQAIDIATKLGLI